MWVGSPLLLILDLGSEVDAGPRPRTTVGRSASNDSQQRRSGAVKEPVKRLLFWTPRGLCILFALFISLLALDVFAEGYGFWEALVALMIHLIPTWVIVAVLVISWRREWIGAALFGALGLLYIVVFWEPSGWPAYLMISGPLFLIGGLFLVNWRYRKELRPTRGGATD
jgi:hypothetical protein